PWGEDAFRRAKELDRPILLDIGATWCHWCQWIDRESYEDPDLAKVINEHFVAVKVDRDERPDIDARYQQAVGAIAGQGGWPLTGFLTSDGKAFYGGTYFPPKDTHGRPGFRRVLLAMAEYYRTNRADTLREADALHQALAEGRKPLVEEGVANEEMLDDTARLLANYVHAGQLTKDPIYRDTAEGILAWAEEVLSDRTRGGYYASQDADVGLDDDGDYFTWTLEELKAAVDPEEARVLVLFYEVGERGEMHHNPRKNVLFIDQEPEAIAKALGTPVDRV